MFKKIEQLGIQMYEGDFGEVLPIKIVNGEILENDVLRFIIQDSSHTDIINKEVEVSDNSISFSLTEEESKLLKKNSYYWGLKQYRDNLLVDTLTANNKFLVVRGQ